MLDNEKWAIFNGVLMKMARSSRSRFWFKTHSIDDDIVDEMIELGYLAKYEKSGEIYYEPTQKSYEIW